MMFCPNCGKEISDSAKVCGYCGYRRVAPPQPVSEKAVAEQKYVEEVKLPAPEEVAPVMVQKPEQPILQKEESPPSTPVAQPAVAPKSPKKQRKASLPGWVWVVGVLGLAGVAAAILIVSGVITLPGTSPLPARANDLLSNGRVIYYTSLDENQYQHLDYDSRYVDFSEGFAEIDGNDYDYPYISYWNEGITAGEGAMIAFQYAPGTQWNISLLSGEYGTPRHRQWGIGEDLRSYFVEGESWYSGEELVGNLNLRPNTWYYLLLAKDASGQFGMLIWERNHPDRTAEVRQQFYSTVWSDRHWVLWISSTKGNLVIDEIAEVAFSGLR